MEVCYINTGYLEITIGRWREVIRFKDPSAFEKEVPERIYLFSPNQRKTMIAETEKLIATYDAGDCPTMLHFLLRGIKEAH